MLWLRVIRNQLNLCDLYITKWKASGDSSGSLDALEHSRNLYEEGFNKVPTDTYTGINAASKSALLGEINKAKGLADKVLTRLNEIDSEHGAAPSKDDWERVTKLKHY